MIGVINYGIGNLQSVANALQAVAAPYEIVTDPNRVACFDKLVVPGVGAFGACMSALTENGFREPLIVHAQAGKPLLGICVGMQMLADKGTEFGEHAGLGLVPGTVVQIPRYTPEIRLPHVGWNVVDLKKDCVLTRNLPSETSAYFLHSFHFKACHEANIVATVEYGSQLTAVVERDNVFGVQFHPEKSQIVGLTILRNFASI